MLADIPPAVWFSYHYTSSAPNTPIVKQRVKVEALHAAGNATHPRVAHLTNYIFQQSYIPKHQRSKVRWESICGTRVEEHFDLFELLAAGEGVSEDKTLRLIIGENHVLSRSNES